MALLLSAQQYVPTLHLSKTSWWSGTRINQIRFGSYPDTGLIEFARAEAVARAGTWDTWGFGCLAVHPTDQKNLGLLVEAGDTPRGNIVRIIQMLRPRDQGFGFVGNPHFTLLIQGQALPLDEAEAPNWQKLLFKGISKLKSAADNWEQWSRSPTDQAVSGAAG